MIQDIYTGRSLSQAKPSNKRIMVGIPMTGLLRAEWVLARYGQVVPCNWSQVDCLQWLDPHCPLRFMVADARNIVVDAFCKDPDFEWLFFIDHDVILPQGVLLKINERMIKGDIPVWSGLYFTKSVPSEPLIYRGRGNGYYGKWELGDEVWVDGVHMGCTLIHGSILRAMYAESEPYDVMPGRTIRRVFETPSRVWYDPETLSWNTAQGTEDLEWCTRVMNEGWLAKAGWPKYQEMEFPFLIDTGIFCRHIDFNGVQYPSRNEHLEFVKSEDVSRRDAENAEKGKTKRAV